MCDGDITPTESAADLVDLGDGHHPPLDGLGNSRTALSRRVRGRHATEMVTHRCGMSIGAGVGDAPAESVGFNIPAADPCGLGALADC
jgi:hypothetical protein